MGSRNRNYEKRSTDVLIIGAGAAGLRAAIELVQNGISCLVVGKRSHGDAHTRMAAGGINAALGSLDPEDRWQIHAADTVREGHCVCQPAAVEILAREAPDRIRELEEWGCQFSRTKAGKVNQRYFGAQTYRRTCFVGDTTGASILQTVVAKAKTLNIPYVENVFIIAIVKQGDKAVGALGYDRKSGELLFFEARAVILAAGGYTSLYSRSTSRLDENLGDAPALAYRAGASLRDMEFVQFHPTGMVKPREMSGTLVTEAVRGEGGRLFNAQGDRFMERYSPGKMELEARDVVARAIFEEIRSGRGTPEKAVQLDISHKDPDFIRERLPAMYRRFQEQGIDITKEPMQVAPTAHYSMGGVKVNFETGATDVDGLFAVGEATSGLHGANRLGGNSLAETLVFGKITGTCLAASLSERPAEPRRAVEEAVERSVLAIEEAMTSKGTYDPEDLIEELRDLMWEHAGIVRSDEGLRKGIEKHEILAAKANDLSVAAGSVRDPKCEWALNLRSMLLTAETVLRGALLRTESRGAHCRDDATETDPSWEKNILYVQGKDEKMRLTTESIPPISDEVKTVLDKGAELDYHQLE